MRRYFLPVSVVSSALFVGWSALGDPPQPASSATPATAVVEPANGSQPHTVKSGDTLIKIAQANHTTVRAIRTANNLKSDRITVGQKLKIPAKSAQAAATETASANPSLASGAPVSH